MNDATIQAMRDLTAALQQYSERSDELRKEIRLLTESMKALSEVMRAGQQPVAQERSWSLALRRRDRGAK